MADLEIAGYMFRDAELLATALTHSSYLHEHVGKGVRDFERLEFLGDAVVDLVIGEELYRRFPDATEGELTSLRATLVSSTALAEIGRQLGLPERARLGRGEEETGGRTLMGLAASLYEEHAPAVGTLSPRATSRLPCRQGNRTLAREGLHRRGATRG